MRFQGENCTLSFGLYFDKGQVLLNGRVWPRRPGTLGAAYELPDLRFNTLFSEEDMGKLQHWLLAGSPESLGLPAPLGRVHRLPDPDNGRVQFAVELTTDQVPAWWNWDVEFPLTVRLEVGQNEFTYLTQTLNREHWSADLTW